MFLKKYCNLFIIISLSFFKTHVIQASFASGAITLSKQCYQCGILKCTVEELQEQNKKWEEERVALINEKAILNKNNKLLTEQNKILQVDKKQLEDSNQTLRFHQEQLAGLKKVSQVNQEKLEASIKQLTVENNALKIQVKEKDADLTKTNHQNNSLKSTVFYYKCGLGISLLLLVMSLIYPRIINKSTVFYYKCGLGISLLLLVMSLIYPRTINNK